MMLTQADKKAASEGFHYIALRGGKRVAYCTTQKEAHREAGSTGKVYCISKMRYAARNPWKAMGHKQDVGRGGKIVVRPSEWVNHYVDAAGNSHTVRVSDIGDAVEGLFVFHVDKQSASSLPPLRVWGGRTTGLREAKAAADEYAASHGWATQRTARNPKRKSYRSLDREIERREAVGLPVAHLIEQRDRLKRRNPRSFANWLDTFLEEKEIDLDHVMEVKGRSGVNWMPVRVVVQAMKMAPKHEQERIKTMLVKIDFMNAPVVPYFAHLGQALARNPKRNPTWTTAAILAGAAYVYGRYEPVRSSVHSLARAAGAGAKHAAEKAKAAADEYSRKREAAKQNPTRKQRGLTPVGKIHLLQTMHKAGADTFKKKVRYVRKHMPHVTDPQAFVGYIVKGER